LPRDSTQSLVTDSSTNETSTDSSRFTSGLEPVSLDWADELGEHLDNLMKPTNVSDLVRPHTYGDYVNAPKSFCYNTCQPNSKAEQSIKSSRGIISGKLEQSRVEPGGLMMPKFLKPYADLFSVVSKTVQPALGIAAMLGLNMPTSVAETKPVQISAAAGFTYGKGVSTAQKYAMDPEAGISTAPIVGGIDYDEMDLNYVMGTPMMTSQFGLVAATGVTLVASTNPAALLGQYTYVDFVTRNFQFCSGSYKFKTYITASTMHSVKLVFYLATDALQDYQSCYFRQVDVQGDTEFEFTLPYCPYYAARDTLTETTYYSVYVKILAWSQPIPTASTPIYINVYKAAASDFRVAGLMDMQFVPTSNPRQDFAKTFLPFHPSMTGYVPDNIIYPETYTTVREIVHRTYPYYSQLGGNTFKLWQSGSSTVVGKELWGLIYMFRRGSLRFKALQRYIAGSPSELITGALMVQRFDVTPHIYLPGLDVTWNDRPFVECEVPWYSHFLYSSTTVDTGPQYWAIPTDANILYLCCGSCGDDFSFHFLIPPPPGTLSPTGSDLGFAAASGFYS